MILFDRMIEREPMQLKSTAKILTSLAQGKVLANPASFSADRQMASAIGFETRLQQQVSSFHDFSGDFMRDLGAIQNNLERLGQVRNPEVFAEYKKRQEELRDCIEKETAAHALQTQAMSDFKKLAQDFNQSRTKGKIIEKELPIFQAEQMRIQTQLKQIDQTYTALRSELGKLDRVVKQSIVNAGVVLPSLAAQNEKPTSSQKNM